eukprot:766302-Hanusia_phi.AAC.4
MGGGGEVSETDRQADRQTGRQGESEKATETQGQSFRDWQRGRGEGSKRGQACRQAGRERDLWKDCGARENLERSLNP